jgi:pyruvate/2-oxoglutarate dehydrogenase complex dihydrolipoamide acyltransferase (E2) component
MAGHPWSLASLASRRLRRLGLLALIIPGASLVQTPATAQAQAQAQAEDCGRGAEPRIDEERWKITEDGTVGDEQNGIIWKQCPEGLRGARCREGRLAYVTWEKALEIAETSTFAGFDDWRLPKLDELRQLIQPGCLLPAVNLAVFPNTPSGWFWFDSAEADNSPRAGQLGFAFGEDFSANQRHVVHLRLVRDVPEEAPPPAEAEDQPQQQADPTPEEAPEAAIDPALNDAGGEPPAADAAADPQAEDNPDVQNAQPGADAPPGEPAPDLPADAAADPAAAANPAPPDAAPVAAPVNPDAPPAQN